MQQYYDETTPILIVGGSLVGLTTALLLSTHNVPYLLVEKHAGISPFPRASGFNPRTLEILRETGIEPAIRKAEPPDIQNMSIVSVETLAGKELTTHVTNLSDFVSPLSPARGSVITQDLMEPVLRARAEELGGDLRFNTELVSFEQDEEGVSAIIRNRVSGQERTVRASYMVAADGHASAIRQRLGIAMQGRPGSLSHVINMLFKADLREALRGRRILVCYVTKLNAFFGGTEDGGMVGIGYHPEQGERVEDYNGEKGIEAIRSAIGIDDLAVKIDNVVGWEMAAYLAERFQYGRIFLAGDSAHVMPPSGGMGANTGIADAHNLAWKLALVVKGQADPSLLDSYSAERRPIAQATIDQAFALGVQRMGLAALAQLPPSFKIAAIRDYNEIMFGYRYDSGAVFTNTETSSASSEQAFEDPSKATGHPGTRAAHIVLERNGASLSTIDLFGKHYVLLTNEQGSGWSNAVQQAAASTRVEIKSYSIGKDLIDIDQRFHTMYGLSAEGAVLVRPDGFIAWQAQSGEEEKLTQVIKKVTGK